MQTVSTLSYHEEDKTNLEGFWARRGGNIAGFGYVLANITWIFFGLATFSIREFIAGAVNLHGGLSRMFYSRGTFFGIRNYGTKTGAVSGALANVITTLPALLAGSPAAIASNVLIFSSQYMDFCSEKLIRRHRQSQNIFFRLTLGQPRLVGGVIRLLSRLPIIALGFAADDWGRVGVFALLAVADVASALSQPAMAPLAADVPQQADITLAKLQVIQAQLAESVDTDSKETALPRTASAP